MPPEPASPVGLHRAPDSPVKGLAVFERRVTEPRATIVCVHGGLDRGGSFARLARRTDGFDVVAYDRRGYQASRALGPLSLDAHVSDLVAVVERERARGPVIVFGHSYGGVVTFAACAQQPRLANLVVNYESSLPWVLARPSSRPVVSSDPAAEAETFFRRMVSDQAWERLSEPERESRRLDGPALINDLRVVRGPAPFALRDVTVPAVYVHGDGPLVRYYRALCREIVVVNPSIVTQEMSHAGHGVHLSSPDQLARLLSDLWDETCASA